MFYVSLILYNLYIWIYEVKSVFAKNVEVSAVGPIQNAYFLNSCSL